MLSLVTAAEQQYRQQTSALDRELALVATIRERRTAQAVGVVRPVRRPAPRAQRAGWPRPIGARLAHADSVAATACVA